MVELRRLLQRKHDEGNLNGTEKEKINLEWGRFRFLRSTQQDIENYLFGDEDAPFSYPEISPQDFIEEKSVPETDTLNRCSEVLDAEKFDTDISRVESVVPLNSNSAAVPSATSEEEDVTLLSETPGAFERTLPMLWLDNEVLVDHISERRLEYDNTFCLSLVTAVSNVSLLSGEKDSCANSGGIKESRKRRKINDYFPVI